MWWLNYLPEKIWENHLHSFLYSFPCIYIYLMIYIYVYIRIIPTRNHVHSCLIILGGRGSVSFWRPFLENTESLPQTWGPKQPEFLWQMSNVCPVPKLWSLSGILFSKRDAYGKKNVYPKRPSNWQNYWLVIDPHLLYFSLQLAGCLSRVDFFKIRCTLHLGNSIRNSNFGIGSWFTGWWLSPTPLKNGVKVSDDEIPNMMGKSFKMPWFQSPTSSF
jgi:hypothetical protein